jgi:hypothetical protein
VCIWCAFSLTHLLVLFFAQEEKNKQAKKEEEEKGEEEEEEKEEEEEEEEEEENTFGGAVFKTLKAAKVQFALYCSHPCRHPLTHFHSTLLFVCPESQPCPVAGVPGSL